MTNPSRHPSRSALRRFASELNRRHVTQTALIYLVAGLGLIEFVDIVAPVYDISVRAERAIIKVVIGGFPLALLTAWLFEIRADGLGLRPRSAGIGISLLVIASFTAVIAVTGFAVTSMPASPAGPSPDAGSGPVDSAHPREAADAGTPGRMTAAFRETPILDALHEFSAIAGRSIVAGRGVGDQLVTADIRGDPWDEALRGILVGHDLELREQGRVVVVMASSESASSADPATTATPPARPDPAVSIASPEEWVRGRPLSIPAGGSLPLRGTVTHDIPVTDVLLNGRRLELEREGERARFSGTLHAGDARFGDVALVVRLADGDAHVANYPATISRPPAPDTARAAASPPSTDAVLPGAANRQRHAVIIGVSDYASGNIGDLRYADDDARAIYEFLRSPAAGMGGIPESNIRLLLNEEATTRNIRSSLTTFLRRSTPDDVVLVFLAGHGVPDPYRPDDLYFLSHDSEMSDLPATAIPMAGLAEWLRNAYAYQTIVLSDVLHSAGVGAGTRSASGNAVNTVLLEHMDRPSGGFVAFTASEANQLSQEGERFGGGHGVFTYYLLEGLEGAADETGDRVVTIGEMMQYTRDRVRRETRNAQIPTISLTTYDRDWPMAAVLPPRRSD